MSKVLVVALALVAIAIPTAAPAQSTAVRPLVVSITAVNGRPVAGIKQVTVKKGRLVRLVIRTNVGSELHLHGYDIEKTPRKGVPTLMQFVANLTGRFDLELHDPDAVLARLKVTS
jgi:hypothetical protein